MSRALDKHRIAVKYGDGLDSLVGFDWGGFLGGASGGVADMLDAKDQADAAKKQQQQEQAQQQAQQAPSLQNARDAQAARARATQAYTDAKTADLKAKTEKNPNGPLHIAAKKAHDRASTLDQLAKQAEDKSTYTTPDSGPPTGGSEKGSEKKSETSKHWYGKVPWWGWAAGGTAVVGLAGFLIWRRRK
jgi:cobalamin biosynthesis Mg chelatase CobN